jgi:hypothetical protein
VLAEAIIKSKGEELLEMLEAAVETAPAVLLIHWILHMYRAGLCRCAEDDPSPL